MSGPRGPRGPHGERRKSPQARSKPVNGDLFARLDPPPLPATQAGKAAPRPVNGDLFAHFGLTPPPASQAHAAAPRPATACPRCTWLIVTGELCTICDHVPATPPRSIAEAGS